MMRKFKSNGLVLVAGIVAAGTFAFKAPVAQSWVFTGSTESQIKDADAYTLSNTTPSNCEVSASLPCSLHVEATNRTQLQAYLDPKSTEEIMDEADGQRD
ncbi:hypothetical protein [Pontibacter liquoris]|uniref:hypothetical protein n=1 Tax=Pontibacter liquoris TaxID=2905677 RepID=UPI001FA6D171|nr:hypothetical protein [Pontibacter liquoris]